MQTGMTELQALTKAATGTSENYRPVAAYHSPVGRSVNVVVAIVTAAIAVYFVIALVGIVVR